MDSGFTSWTDIGSLYGLMLLLLFAIILFSLFLHIKIKIKQPSATGGRGKSMKGGYSKDNLIFFVSMALFIGVIIYMFASGLNTGGHGVRL